MERNRGLTGFLVRLGWFLSATRTGLTSEFVRFMVDCGVYYGG
jgi:hypothetical protein